MFVHPYVRRFAAAALAALLVAGLLPALSAASPAAAVTSMPKISGKVTDVDGVPIEGIEVRVMNESWDELGPVRTAADGTYTFTVSVPSVYSNEYYVYFSDADKAYVPEWYDDATEYSGPRPVIATSTKPATGINAVLSKAGRATGRVTDASGTPLAGIEVYAIDPDGWDYTRSVTGTDGVFIVGEMLPTGVHIWAEDPKRNYVGEYYLDTRHEYEAQEVDLVLGAPTELEDMKLDRAVKLSGKVKFGSTPVPYMAVEVLRHDPARNAWVWGSNEDMLGGESAMTDRSGTYKASVSAPGDYRLFFYDYVDRYASRYYKASGETAMATTITASVPGEVIPLEDTQVTKRGTIRGVVTDRVGTPLAGIEVEAVEMEDDGWSYGYSARTDRYGRYSFRGLDTGTYTVTYRDDRNRFAPRYYPGVFWESEADTVEVVAPAATTLKPVRMMRGSRISGIVTDKAGKPVPKADVSLAVVGPHSEWEFGMEIDARTDAQGRWSLSGITPGPTHVEAIDYYGRYLATLYDGVDLLNDAVDPARPWGYGLSYSAADYATATVVTPVQGMAVDGVTVKVRTAASVSGTVTADPEGTAIADAYVQLVRLETDGWRTIGETWTNAKGGWKLAGVAPGSYTIRVTSRARAGRYLGGAANVADAETFSVTEGDVVTGKSVAIARGGTVGGVVRGADGPLFGVEVMAVTKSGTRYETVGGDMTDAYGRYRIDSLPPGDYRLAFKEESWYRPGLHAAELLGDTTDWAAAQVVSIATTEVVTADATLSAGFAARGLLGGIGVPRYQGEPSAYVALNSTNPDPFISALLSEFAPVYDDRSWRVANLADGGYRIMFFDGWDSDGVGSYFYDGAYHADAATIVPIDAAHDDLSYDATIPAGATIEGTVSAAAGYPIGSPRVAVTAHRSDGMGGFEVFDGALVDRSGRFEMRKLPPGTYVLEFDDLADLYGSVFSGGASTIDGAAQITVGVGERASANATLDPLGQITKLAVRQGRGGHYGIPMPIVVSATDLRGWGIPGRTVRLLQSTDASNWSQVATLTTGLDGNVYTKRALTGATYFKAEEVGGDGLTTTPVLVKPSVRLGFGVSSRTVAPGQAFVARAILAPRAKAGSYPVKVVIERRVNGVWKPFKTLSARAADYGTASSRCTARVTISTRGAYRLRAYRPGDARFAPSYSSARYVTVK